MAFIKKKKKKILAIKLYIWVPKTYLLGLHKGLINWENNFTL